MRILLQFPEGLKKEALKYQEKYEKEGHEVFIASAPCYGGCDLPIDEARWIKADKIVHFGHEKFVKKDLPIEVEYIPYYVDVDLDKVTQSFKKLQNYKSIALGTTIQHIHQYDKLKQELESLGHQVYAENGNWAIKTGQILGCDSLSLKKVADKCDCAVIVADGMFHPLAIDIENKPVFVIHPQTGQLKQINDEIEKLKKKRKANVIAAVDAKTFGILVSTKVGQFLMAPASKIKKELEKRGKKALILVSNEIEPLPLQNFMLFDCYVNTACPRLADDTDELGKPCINYDQLLEVFKILDEIQLFK